MQVSPTQKQPTATERHRRQYFWQILLPILLAALIFFGLGVLVSLPAGSGAVSVDQWAAISTIWLVMPWIFLTILFVGLTAGLIYLMARLLRLVPIYTRLVNLYIQIIGVRLQTFSDRLAAPFINFHGWWAGWKMFWKALKGRGRD